MATELGIDGIASAHEFPEAIRRLTNAPSGPVKYPYLVVSENPDDAPRADVLMVRNFERIKEKLKKKTRSGVGLEVHVSQVRALDAKATAKWLGQLQELHKFCKMARCQLVVSSGAKSPFEMVSARSFDALLRECRIDPATYWHDLEKWLDSRLARRVTI